MAGLYPDVPAPRMAYDRDGSTGFYASSDGSFIGTLTAGQLLQLNDESTGDAFTPASSAQSYHVGLIFPQLRDVVAFLTAGTSAQPHDFEVSEDTTNGHDGTWVTAKSGFFPIGSGGSYLRTGIIELDTPATGIKGVRIGQAAGIDILHVYGMISDGQVLDRLRFWHPTLDQPLSETPAFLDYGEVNRSSSENRTFRVRNDSDIMTAHTVSVYIDVPTDADPSLSEQFSLDIGAGPSSSVELGDLAPGTLSSVVTVHRTTAAAAQLGLWTARIITAAASWT